MGSYRYCSVCQMPLDPPTLEEAFRDEYRCSEGHFNVVWDSEKIGALIELEERVKNLEENLIKEE